MGDLLEGALLGVQGAKQQPEQPAKDSEGEREDDGPGGEVRGRVGRTVWARESDPSRTSMHTQLGADGTSILIDQNSFWVIFDQGAASSVDRVNIEGEVTQTWDTPGLHHPFTELPDGTFAWGAAEGLFDGESLKTIRPDGTEHSLLRCQDFLDAEAGGGNEDTYCGSNTLSYDAQRDTFLYSFYSLETMIEIDAESGETVRYFGHTGADAWGFDPPESAFWWQHGGHCTESGTLLVSSKGEDAAEETVLREYTLDADSSTLVEVFSFGEGEGGVVWDVAWDAETPGRSTPVPDLYALR